MAEVRKSVLVGHSAAQMFALVDAVENYPEFLPWCSGTELIHRDAQVLRAEIRINYRGVKQRFSTENPKEEPHWMRIALLEGPFKSLSGEWRFTELGASGCRIDFNLRWEFSSRLLEMLVSPVFNHIANNLVDAFVARARKVYG